jgi:hypothetical protein
LRREADWQHDVVEARERSRDPGDDALLEWAAEQRVLITVDNPTSARSQF